MSLSLRARELIRIISSREAAGFNLDEIAVVLDRRRPELRHLELPERVTKAWLAARMRDVRREIEAMNGTATWASSTVESITGGIARKAANAVETRQDGRYPWRTGGGHWPPSVRVARTLRTSASSGSVPP